MFFKTTGATITVVKTNEKFHTYEDLGLIITNACSISNPEMNEAYIEIKGRNGLLDISEALTGKATYKSRHISISLAGINEQTSWDIIMSDLRNRFDGKLVNITFDNDPAYYWTGRAHLTSFERDADCGRFIFDIPAADPYKYRLQAFNESWLWDSFNFNTDYVTEETEYTINQHTEITLPAGHMPVSPTIIVTNINTYLTVQKYGDARVIPLSLGENKVYAITVNDTSESILMFEGDGTFSINYRGGSL